MILTTKNSPNHGEQSEPNLAFKARRQERFIRCKFLGADYTEDTIRERISSRRIVSPKPKIIAPTESRYKPNLLIDIQAKLQQANSPGFEHWVRIYNLKESAKALMFLQERGLTEYEKLVKKTEAVGKIFRVNNELRKVIDNRLKEIAELQKHIATYGKTRVHFWRQLSMAV